MHCTLRRFDETKWTKPMNFNPMQILFVLRKSLRATDSPTFAIILTSFSVDFFSFLKWFAIMTLFFCSIKNTIQRLSTTPDFIVYLLFADFSTIIFDFTEIHRFLINFFRLFILANDLTLTITSIRFADAASQNFFFIIIVNLRKLIFWWIWNSSLNYWNVCQEEFPNQKQQ